MELRSTRPTGLLAGGTNSGQPVTLSERQDSTCPSGHDWSFGLENGICKHSRLLDLSVNLFKFNILQRGKWANLRSLGAVLSPLVQIGTGNRLSNNTQVEPTGNYTVARAANRSDLWNYNEYRLDFRGAKKRWGPNLVARTWIFSLEPTC